MQTTITIDDRLYRQALEMLPSGMDESDLFPVAVQTFVQVQTARRLVALGGQVPRMHDVPSRAVARTKLTKQE